jgi:hypothetical protein
MASESDFPLRASDQADVIRIFLDLMIENERAERAPEVTANQPVAPRNGYDNPWYAGNLPDSE